MVPAEFRTQFDPLAAKTIETALAAPQVITHRLTRMAIAGHNPTERDIQEFNQMWLEKVEAFYESWSGMMLQAMRVQQGIWQANLEMVCKPWWEPGSPAEMSASMTAFGNGVLGMWNKGLAPVHRRTVANVRRLAKS